MSRQVCPLVFYALFLYLIVVPGTPFCGAVRAYSSVVELIEHVSDTVLSQLVYPGQLVFFTLHFTMQSALQLLWSRNLMRNSRL